MGWIINRNVDTGYCDVINKDYIVSFKKEQIDDKIAFNFEMIDGTTQKMSFNLTEFDNEKVLKKFFKELGIDYKDIMWRE